MPFLICLKHQPNSLLWSTRVIKSIPEPSNKEASSLLSGILCFSPEIYAISLNSTCIPWCRKQLKYNFQINSFLGIADPAFIMYFWSFLAIIFSYDALETSPLLHKLSIIFVNVLKMSGNYHRFLSSVFMLHHQVFSDLSRINWWLVCWDSSWLIKIK